MNIVTFVLGTIFFQAVVFSLVFLSRFFDKIFPTSHKHHVSFRKTGSRFIILLLALISISALTILSSRWFLFYIINFALVVIGIGIYMLIEKKTMKSH